MTGVPGRAGTLRDDDSRGHRGAGLEPESGRYVGVGSARRRTSTFSGDWRSRTKSWRCLNAEARELEELIANNMGARAGGRGVSRAGEWQETRLGDHLQIKHGYAFKGEYFADEGPFIVHNSRELLRRRWLQGEGPGEVLRR